MAEYDYSGILRQISNNVGVAIDNIGVVNDNIGSVSGQVKTVNSNVQAVLNDVQLLERKFDDYVKKAENQHQLSLAETRIVKIRQELEQKFGKYEAVRNHTVGILQADDLALVRKNTIVTVTEELMIATPGYWLAPCLLALSAWIDDRQDIADRALREGIKRNDEKTSLLFALICRRADRKPSSLKWVQRYLANQDEERLDRTCIIILDAFASGLLGADSEGVVSKQLEEWISRLTEKPGFTEQQTKQWSAAINLKRTPLKTTYTYLEKYSKTWPRLRDIMEGAHLHANILSYFEGIFAQQSSSIALKEQLDEILDSLVKNYDEEELPLRKQEKLNQFIIDYDGDKPRAEHSMSVEESALETHKDFTQLLTDAAMKPETSHSSVSTQKFAIALSRDWISNAYNDVVAKNRMQIPQDIEINIDNFNNKTQDGKNESELVKGFEDMCDNELKAALVPVSLTGFQKFQLWGGIVLGVIGLLACVFGSIFLGIIALIIGVGWIINHFSKKKAVKTKRELLIAQFAEKKQTGVELVRATLAEVVDFRALFAKKDAESQKVVDFLEQIKPEQYVRKLSETTRRIKTGE